MARPRVVLITGASTGIGKATAIEMRGRGWRVFATVRRQEDVISLTQIGRGLIEPLMMDVTDAESVARAVETIRARAGRLDALVNNAGIAVGGPIEKIGDDEMQRQFEVNFFGVHRVTRAVLPMLREARGRIVMVSSVGGQVVTPLNGPYCASKAALESLAASYRLELKGIVKVIIIAPGAVRTPIWEKSATVDQMERYVDEEHYPRADLEHLSRLFLGVGDRGIEAEAVGAAIGNALELPWPLARWVVADRQGLITQALLRALPAALADRLTLRGIRWQPRG